MLLFSFLFLLRWFWPCCFCCFVRVSFSFFCVFVTFDRREWKAVIVVLSYFFSFFLRDFYLIFSVCIYVFMHQRLWVFALITLVCCFPVPPFACFPLFYWAFYASTLVNQVPLTWLTSLAPPRQILSLLTKSWLFGRVPTTHNDQQWRWLSFFVPKPPFIVPYAHLRP